MFSPQFMKFLINYQKDEFTPEPSKKEIYFKSGRGRKLTVKVTLPAIEK